MLGLKISHLSKWVPGACINPCFLLNQEFPYTDDTIYLAHCYPYTYSDLKDDLDTLMEDPERAKIMKRDVLCETRAGNSCFLVTVTDFGKKVYFVVTVTLFVGNN